MSKLSSDFIVEAPADAVWEVVGRRFHQIGGWATAIPASTPIPAPAGPLASMSAALDERDAPATLAAPVAGRVCHVGARLLPQVEERLVAYDEANRALTYEANGLPAFVTTARNTWTVVPLDQRRTRVRIEAQFDTRGVLGQLGRWAIFAQVGRTTRYLADDLRHYVEHGTPSPRKLQQLRRTRRS
jgi:carbon monoxide dehydrogenase subunit G